MLLQGDFSPKMISVWFPYHRSGARGNREVPARKERAATSMLAALLGRGRGRAQAASG